MLIVVLLIWFVLELCLTLLAISFFRMACTMFCLMHACCGKLKRLPVLKLDFCINLFCSNGAGAHFQKLA